MNRRTFVKLGAAVAPAVKQTLAKAATSSSSIPIIDTHIHLFDTTRPQGVPWPPKDDAMRYKPALPGRYESIARPLGVVGAIEIEASPWLKDNQWVLDVAAESPMIVGTVGDLEPGKPKFRMHLDRFCRNRLFRGIRYGNLWGRDLGARLGEAAFIADLKALAAADLELDTANPDPALIHDVVLLTDKVPGLRMVIDHLPELELPAGPAARRAYDADLRRLGDRPQVYVKVSGVLRKVNGRVPLDVSAYRPTLDHIWDIFGQDRLLYGSDWPNSDPLGTYAQVLDVVRRYFAEKGRGAAEKFFWKNSVSAYRWSARETTQPELTSPH